MDKLTCAGSKSNQNELIVNDRYKFIKGDICNAALVTDIFENNHLERSQEDFVSRGEMKITETKLKGCFIIEPTLFKDDRGLFYESYQKDEFEKQLGKRVNFFQDNVSISKKGVLRGLHFQKGIHSQAKLVQVLKGEALDVVVDLRKHSPTYGQHFKTKLSEYNYNSLFIPKGMAHGFVAMTEEVIFTYKCDNYYNHQAEGGIMYNDIDLNIDWEIPGDKVILSKKDLELPTLKDLNL